MKIDGAKFTFHQVKKNLKYEVVSEIFRRHEIFCFKIYYFSHLKENQKQAVLLGNKSYQISAGFGSPLFAKCVRKPYGQMCNLPHVNGLG